MGEQGSSGQRLGRSTPALKVARARSAALYDRPARHLSGGRQPHPALPDRRQRSTGRCTGAAGTTVDGVLAVDPVVLSYLLKATGPVPVPGGVAARQREGRAAPCSPTRYQRLDSGQAGRVLRGLGGGGVRRLLHREGQPAGVAVRIGPCHRRTPDTVLERPPEEQRTFAGNRMAGALPEQENVPTVGVFLNDGSGAKLGYYLRPSATLTVGDMPPGRPAASSGCGSPSARPRRPVRASHSVLGLGLAGDPYTARTLVSSSARPAARCSPAGSTEPSLRGRQRHRTAPTGRIANVEVAPRCRPGPGCRPC